MGTHTDFSGCLKLSRHLTPLEAKDLLLYNEDVDRIPAPHPDGYLQWVPGSTLNTIGWDGNEKFYNYVEWLQWVVNWLEFLDVHVIDGEIFWASEAQDSGRLTVHKGIVDAARFGEQSLFEPLRLRDLKV